MISQTSDIHGNFIEGNVCCDNKSCQKVLYKWFEKEDAPDEDESCFFAYSVKTRLKFNRFPTNLAIAAMNPSVVLPIQDKYFGYILDFDVLPLKLDFCSIDCSLAWLNDDTKYGLGRNFQQLKEKKLYGVIVYSNNPEEQSQLVADHASRFETLVIGNFLPTSAPKNQFKLPIGQRINIAGRSFNVRKSTALRPGEKEPAIGIEMTTLMFKCPMKPDLNQTCNQLMQVIADFTPSVWVCPKCNGIIIFDQPSNILKHSNANLRNSFSIGNFAVYANYYFDRPDWGNIKFVKWIRDNIGTDLILIADAYQDTGMFNNAFISSSFVDLDDVTNLFGPFIS